MTDLGRHSNNDSVQSLSARPSEGTTPAEQPVRISAQGEFELAANEDLPIHPAAAAFPVDPHELEEMAKSFQADGQWDPVIVFEEQILDGQKRNLARKRLDMPLRCMRITDLGGLTPFEWAVRKNLAAGTARHLTDSQRGLIGARLCREVYEQEAKERITAGKQVPQQQRGKACERAATVVNVRTNRVRQGLKVYDAGWPELANAVWQGVVVISVAAEIAELPAERDRKRALTAAVNENKQALCDILATKRDLLDGLGQKITKRSHAIFLAAEKWHQQVKQLNVARHLAQIVGRDPRGTRASTFCANRGAGGVDPDHRIGQAVGAVPLLRPFRWNRLPGLRGEWISTRAEYEENVQRYASHLGKHGAETT